MTDAKSVSFPVLPLRDIVVFPNMIVPLFVGREKSVRALEAVMEIAKKLFLPHKLTHLKMTQQQKLFIKMAY